MPVGRGEGYCANVTFCHTLLPANPVLIAARFQADAEVGPQKLRGRYILFM
jgi:hypothetical protein